MGPLLPAPSQRCGYCEEGSYASDCVTGAENDVGENRIKHRIIVTQTHFWIYLQYHVRLFFIWLFHFFSPVYAVVKQTPELVFHTTQSDCLVISVNVQYTHRTSNLTITNSAL